MNQTHDSGLIDLSRLAAASTADPPHPDSRPDPSLLGIGLAGPIRARPEEARRSLSGATLLAVLLAFASGAFALHVHHRAASTSDAPIEESIAVAEAPEVPEKVALEEPEPVTETVAPEAVAEANPTPTPATPATARLATSSAPTPRATAPPRRAERGADTRSLDERSLDELMRLSGGIPSVSTDRDDTVRVLRPSRDAVAGAFRAQSAAVRRCAEGHDGVVTARVYLSGDTGTPRSVRLDGAPPGSEACIEDALESIEVEPFLQDRLAITFPYRF
ncbi:MAG: hypothetical protein AAGE52_22515 [Myxococcota bacterium]